MQRRSLGRSGLTVSAPGLGCMGFSEFYGPTDEATAPEPMDGNAQPEYPESLREAGVQGTVIARFVVRADGSVGDVRVVRGPEDLHDAVREALRRWRFRPATVNGHAISVYRTMPFRFVLDNL